MINDFLADELKEKKTLIKLLKNKNYNLLLLKDDDNQIIIGYAFIYKIKTNTIWLDYIAIDKFYHSQGYGSFFINEINKLYYNCIGMFIEVEKPDSTDQKDQQQQVRRISFYKKLKAKRLDIEYLLPTYDDKISLDLYFIKYNTEVNMSLNIIKESISDVFDFIHSDIFHREDILNQIKYNI